MKLVSLIKISNQQPSLNKQKIPPLLFWHTPLSCFFISSLKISANSLKLLFHPCKYLLIIWNSCVIWIIHCPGLILMLQQNHWFQYSCWSTSNLIISCSSLYSSIISSTRKPICSLCLSDNMSSTESLHIMWLDHLHCVSYHVILIILSLHFHQITCRVLCRTMSWAYQHDKDPCTLLL
jgi:hypothetical protein